MLKGVKIEMMSPSLSHYFEHLGRQWRGNMRRDSSKRVVTTVLLLVVILWIVGELLAKVSGIDFLDTLSLRGFILLLSGIHVYQNWGNLRSLLERTPDIVERKRRSRRLGVTLSLAGLCLIMAFTAVFEISAYWIWGPLFLVACFIHAYQRREALLKYLSK